MRVCVCVVVVVVVGTFVVLCLDLSVHSSGLFIPADDVEGVGRGSPTRFCCRDEKVFRSCLTGHWMCVPSNSIILNKVYRCLLITSGWILHSIEFQSST